MSAHHYPGRMISIEGFDGSGKTSTVPTIVSILRAANIPVVVTREPGGSKAGELIRNVILTQPITGKTEILLFAAARKDHMDEIILPALQRGDVVVCDRFADSTYAYQGAGRGLAADVLHFERYVLEDFEPDHTLFFDVTLGESRRRLELRSAEKGEYNRIDSEADAFKRRVYEGYQSRFKANPHRMVRINAMQALEDVRTEVAAWLRTKFLPANPQLSRV